MKPVFLIGGGVNIAHAKKEMTQLAELTYVPVITTIMGKGQSLQQTVYMSAI